MTNQASEDDELKDRLTKLISQDGWVDTQEVDVEGQVAAIQALIRTEKLKLLAEVRERVVGEDLPLPEEIMAQTGTRLYNKIKSEERETLAKLEAEL